MNTAVEEGIQLNYYGYLIVASIPHIVQKLSENKTDTTEAPVLGLLSLDYADVVQGFTVISPEKYDAFHGNFIITVTEH